MRLWRGNHQAVRKVIINHIRTTPVSNCSDGNGKERLFHKVKQLGA